MAPELPNLPNNRRNRATNFFGGNQRGLSPIVRPNRVNRFVRPAASRSAVPEVVQSGSPTRFGKANGIDYLNFFGNKKNTKILKRAIVRLKDLLVEGFKVAKGLRASIANIIEQLKGFGGKAAKGFGILGIIAAIVAAVGALFGPQIKATYDWIVDKGSAILNWISGAAENFKSIWNTISDLAEKVSFGMIKIPQFGGMESSGQIVDDLGDDSNMSEPPASGLGRFLNLGGLFNRQKNTSSSSFSSSSSSATSGSGSGNLARMKNFIGGIESNNNYNVIVGGKNDPSIKEKTVTELNSKFGGQTALGRYQIQMRTALDQLRRNKIDPSTFKFDEKGQDDLFRMILKYRGYDEYLEGTMTKKEFALQLAKEFASVPEDARNRSYYAGDGVHSKTKVTYGQVNELLDSLKPSVKPVTAPPATPSGKKGTNVSFVNLAPSQQVAAAPSRPQQMFSPSGSSGSSPTVAFYDPSNADSFSSLSSKMTYNIVG